MWLLGKGMRPEPVRRVSRCRIVNLKGILAQIAEAGCVGRRIAGFDHFFWSGSYTDSVMP